jgi:diguanylate cyclase (GGDEF)-like protein
VTAPFTIAPQPRRRQPDDPFASIGDVKGQDPFAAVGDVAKSVSLDAGIDDKDRPVIRPSRSIGETGLTHKTGEPYEVPDNTFVHQPVVVSQRPLLHQRVWQAVTGLAKEVREDPAGTIGRMATDIAVAPGRSLAESVFAPGVGDARPDPELVRARFGGPRKSEGSAAPYDVEHGAVTPTQRRNASLQTLANVFAMGAGPKLASQLAAAGATGAAYDTEDPARGALLAAAFVAAPRTGSAVTRPFGKYVRRAASPDFGEGMVESGASDMARASRGTSPPELSDAQLVDRFIADLERGAVDAGTAQPRGVKPGPEPLNPEAREVSDFMTLLTGRDGTARPMKTAPVEGLERSSDVVARQAAIKGTGIQRRPKAEMTPVPEAAVPAPEASSSPTLQQLARELDGEKPHEAQPATDERFPEGFTMGDPEPRIPKDVSDRRARIEGESAPGMYLDKATEDALYAPRGARPTAEPAERVVDVDAEEAARDAAERAANRTPSAPKKDYRTMGRDDLYGELQAEYDRIDAETEKIQGPWTRFDDDIQIQRSGGRFSDARAQQQIKHAARRAEKIEAEISKRYGISVDDITAERLARLERGAMESEVGHGDADTSFDFALPEGLDRRLKEMQSELDQAVEARNTAQRDAETDKLTGVANRAALDRALPAAEADPATSVVVFDANDFGQVNKRVSQEAGDRAIQDVASAIRQAAEEHGIGERVFRRGGDEFVVLAPDALAESVRSRAEQIFGERTFGTGEKGVKVSLSGTHAGTFADADASLQAAKQARKVAAGATSTGGNPAPREYINWRTWGERPEILSRIQQRAEELRASGQLEKGRVSFDKQRQLGHEFAKELLADPLRIDRAKLSKLKGHEIVALKEVVQENTAIIESASRALNSGELSPAEIQDATRALDGARKATDEALATIVRESAEAGRTLGGLRQMARQTLDPDAWIVHAKRLYGDRPLPDSVMLEVRKLAQMAADACQGGS